MSSRMAGNFSSACLAAKEIDNGNIKVVDTRSAGGGVRLLAERAVELNIQGLKLGEIAQALEKERENVSIVFSVEDMDRLRSSGRLGNVRKSVSAVLNIKPILGTQDGAIVSMGTAKGSRQRIEKILELIPVSAKKIVVSYLGDQAAAQELAAALSKKFPGIYAPVSKFGPVIGIYLGTPALGAAWIT